MNKTIWEFVRIGPEGFYTVGFSCRLPILFSIPNKPIQTGREYAYLSQFPETGDELQWDFVPSVFNLIINCWGSLKDSEQQSSKQGQ